MTRILSVLGIVEAPADRPGFGGGGAAAAGGGREEAVLGVLLRARDGLRDVAKAHPSAAHDIMGLADRRGFLAKGAASGCGAGYRLGFGLAA